MVATDLGMNDFSADRLPDQLRKAKEGKKALHQLGYEADRPPTVYVPEKTVKALL